MKNLKNASIEDLQKLLELSIGRAFRMASIGNEAGAMKAKNEALEISREIGNVS